MKSNSAPKLVVLTLAVIIATIFISRPSPEAEACQRLLVSIRLANTKLPDFKTGGGAGGLEAYLRELEAVPLNNVPPEVRGAYGEFLGRLKQSIEVRRNKGNIEEADSALEESEKALSQAINKRSTTWF